MPEMSEMTETILEAFCQKALWQRPKKKTFNTNFSYPPPRLTASLMVRLIYRFLFPEDLAKIRRNFAPDSTLIVLSATGRIVSPNKRVAKAVSFAKLQCLYCARRDKREAT